MKSNNCNDLFEFKKFSPKGLESLLWWTPNYEGFYDGIIADGAVRSSKTVSVLCGFIMWSISSFSVKNFAICAKTLSALNRNIITPLKQILNTWGIRWHENKDVRLGMYIEFCTNRYYYFEFNNELSAGKIQGITLAGIIIDEVTLAPESFINMALSRLSIENAKFFMTCNPDNPFHIIKTAFIDMAIQKNILHLHFAMRDNLTLSEKTIQRYERMYKGAFYKRYILGLWVVAEGLVFDNFDETKIITLPPRADYYYIGIDYGVSNAMTYLLYGINLTDVCSCKVWAEKEYYHNGAKDGAKTNAMYCNDLNKFIGDKTISGIVIDPSALSFKTEIMSTLNIACIDANNDILDGIQYQYSLIGSGEYKVCSGCTETISEYSAYRWDEKLAAQGKDVPIKKKDHCQDNQRYFLNTVYRSLRTENDRVCISQRIDKNNNLRGY